MYPIFIQWQSACFGPMGPHVAIRQPKRHARMQAANGASFEEGLQAVQSKAQQQIALLLDAINAATVDEQAARQKRHTFTLEAVSDMGKLIAHARCICTFGTSCNALHKCTKSMLIISRADVVCCYDMESDTYSSLQGSRLHQNPYICRSHGQNRASCCMNKPCLHRLI